MRIVVSILLLTTVAYATGKIVIVLDDQAEQKRPKGNRSKELGPTAWFYARRNEQHGILLERQRRYEKKLQSRMQPLNSSLKSSVISAETRSTTLRLQAEQSASTFRADVDVNLRTEKKSYPTTAYHRGKPIVGMKYILQWTVPYKTPFNQLQTSQSSFIKRNCSFTNCFVTSNSSYMKQITDFDVVVFNGPELYQKKYVKKLPSKRSSKQKYIFASRESSAYYPLDSYRFNNFFNWTWTYRLNSDIPYGYIIVKDSNNNVIAPGVNVKWMSLGEMDPISDELKEELKSKRKAAAWMVSNCLARSGRQEFVKELQKELRKYWLTVDIYGDCGGLACPVGNPFCMEIVKKNYFFYLAFENSFSTDYVTEKLLTALQNNAVPIVLGGAKYSRFMPPGIYLDARALGPKKLAARMHELTSNLDEYYYMFRWRNYYSYHALDEAPDTDPLCKLCETINNDKRESSVYEDFGDWWVLNRGEAKKKKDKPPALSRPRKTGRRMKIWRHNY